MKLNWITSKLSKQRFYLWILLAGALAGSAVTLLAWLQKWTPLRAPHWLYAALFWVGVAAVLGVGILLQRRQRFLSRLWVLLSVVAAIGLVWLFPETLAPGCGGHAARLRPLGKPLHHHLHDRLHLVGALVQPDLRG